MDINDIYLPGKLKAEQKPKEEKKAKVIYGGPLFDGKGNVFENGCVYILDDKIKEVGSEEEVFAAMPGSKKELELIDTQGKVIFPAMVNAHHHFFSAFAIGLTPKGKVTSLEEKLNKLWWPLDKALNEDSLQIAALLSIMDSIESGVTTIFDHHSSPSVISNSLEIVAGAVEKSGINAILCHELSDRNGKKAFAETLEENLNFIDKYDDHNQIRGTLGLHANFTLSENSIKTIAKNFDPEVGIHIHCGESVSDLTFAKDVGYNGCIDRLNKHKLISNRSIIAHGIYLSDEDLNILEKSESLLVHNPESNADNNVGILNLEISKRVNVGFGTDGITSNLLQSLHNAFLLHRQNGIDENILLEKLPSFIFDNNINFARNYFDQKIGVLEKGANADVVIFDYVPFTPFHGNNIYRHMIYGMHDRKAHTVISRGKVIFQDKVFVSLDKDLILEQAKEISTKVWENYL